MAAPRMAMVSEPSTTSSPDQDLAACIARGEAWAEDELIRRFQPGLLVIARVRGAGELASDLVQETLAAALANLRRGVFRNEAPIETYLASILRRLVARSFAADRSADYPVETIADPGSDPFVATAWSEARARLQRALRALPGRQREILLRHYFDGLTAEEIATELKIPRGTVLSRLHYARRRVSDFMNRSRLREGAPR